MHWERGGQRTLCPASRIIWEEKWKGGGVCAPGPSSRASLPTPSKRGFLVPSLPLDLPARSSPDPAPRTVTPRREERPSPDRPPADTRLHALAEARRCASFRRCLQQQQGRPTAIIYLYCALPLGQVWCQVPLCVRDHCHFTDRRLRLREGRRPT